MGTDRRINVASGRSLEKQAHYSRAVRVRDLVLQSGTTAIDRQGSVRGVGDVAKQVETIMTIAEWSLGKAGGKLADVVRSRIYVTDIGMADRAARTLARYLRDARPAATLVQVNRLARPEQLVEIELDAVDGAGATARRISSGRAIEDEYAYSRAVRVGDRVLVSGSTALSARGVVDGKGDLYRQTRSTMDTIFWALGQAGAAREDIVYTKTFLTDLARTADYTRAWLEALGDVRPTSTLLGIPALVLPEMLIEVEAEAIVGAAKTRRDIYTQQQREKPRGYARAVEVGDWIWVSGCTSMNASGEPQASGDWAAQSDLSVETVQWALEQAGATLDDVVRRRTFTVDGASVNRAHGEGPAWFAKSCPASLGCRIAGLARPELLVEVEVSAVKGAHAGIEWVGPDATDALDLRPG
ncbi:MAG TPA: Rid family hydrolase [Candidatus Binatia bacterium]|nr:Rid family hydrolase [Candidatus Binatia bacterium]